MSCVNATVCSVRHLMGHSWHCLLEYTESLQVARYWRVVFLSTACSVRSVIGHNWHFLLEYTQSIQLRVLFDLSSVMVVTGTHHCLLKYTQCLQVDNYRRCVSMQQCVVLHLPLVIGGTAFWNTLNVLK